MEERGERGMSACTPLLKHAKFRNSVTMHLLDKFPALRRRRSPPPQVTTSTRLKKSQLSLLKNFHLYTGHQHNLEQAQCESKPDQFLRTQRFNCEAFGIGSAMVFWEGYASDEAMGTFAPIVVYWLYAGFCQMLPPLDKYRLHTRKEEEERNLVPLRSVVKGVLLQQLVQVTVAHGVFLVTSPRASSSGVTLQPSLPVQILQIAIAMLVMDTWQYFLHRYMHRNKFMYRHVHSHHHRLVVPYAIGALYNHPLEGLLVDTLGGAVSFLVSGMTARTATIFFCFAVIKAVDDHCGLWLPGNIFHLFFQNNAAYHDIHHRLQGAKYNYSQPFFPIWDKLLGTHMPYRVVKRAEGGFEARVVVED